MSVPKNFLGSLWVPVLKKLLGSFWVSVLEKLLDSLWVSVLKKKRLGSPCVSVLKNFWTVSGCLFGRNFWPSQVGLKGLARRRERCP